MLKFVNNRTKNFYSFIPIITIFSIINIYNCSSDETEIGKIIIRDGNYLAKDYNILFTNKNNQKIDSKSKLCVISSKLDYENNCKPFIKVYYDKWVFIVLNLYSYFNDLFNFCCF